MKKFRIRGRGDLSVWKKGFRLMKLTFLFFLLGLIQVSASLYSQTTKLTLEMRNSRVVDVLEEIEKQSEFRFAYSSELIDMDRRVSVDINKKDIEETLAVIFEGTGVKHVLYDRHIMLYPKEMETYKESVAVQRQSSVSGTVTDETGEPLPGVTVVVKGTTQGTVTNAEGFYLLTDIPDDATLQFSFVGMRTQEIEVGNKTSIDVTLKVDAIGIEEVVAVGYGTQKKANLTGAVGIATAERLEKRPIVSVGQGLQGVIPNLNISIRNGDPTTKATFNIRGFESINGGSPLILVDGVPMDLELINPNDIESVNVLKDAASAAVYGARAAFGVILVQTKKGQGKVRISLSTEQSLAKPIFLLDPETNPYKVVTAWNDVWLRSRGKPFYSDAIVEGTRRWVENPTEENAWGVINNKLTYFGNNDYQNKMITDYAPQQKYDMNISGSSENASYFVSFGYLNKDGYLKNSEKNENFKRYNILMKGDFTIKKWLAIDSKIVFNSQVNDKPHFYSWDVNINSLARVNPIFPIQFPDLPYYIEPGDRDKYKQYIGMYLKGSNNNFFPYLEQGGRQTFTTNDTWLTQGITLTPLEGLKIRGDFSYNTFINNYQDVASKVEIVEENLLSNPMIVNGFSGDDWVNNRSVYNQYYVFNSYAEYTMSQSGNHYLKAMLGFNQEWGRDTYTRAMARQLIIPQITDLNATTGTQQTWGGKSHFSLRGMFYRLNYIFKEKYLVELNGRYDGSSRFPKERRFGFFPSFSAGWRISSEPFMAGTNAWLDNLKIRASYGELGNQLFPTYYPYISSMPSGMSNVIMTNEPIPYIAAAGIVSPSLTWETVISQNLGLDITMLNQRLDFSGDIYIRDTKDMLMRMDYPDYLGTTAPYQNAADLRTKGWELSLNWNDRIGSDWLYSLTLALSDNQTEITKYDNPSGSLEEYYVGQQIGEIWGFVTEGIFQTEEEVASHVDQSQLGSNWGPGDIQYADLDNDGEITWGSMTLDDPGDRTIIGNKTPRYSFGINPDVTYKNWSLNIFFQGLFRDYLPSNAGWNAFYPFSSFYVDKYYLSETWSETNRDAYFGRPYEGWRNRKNIQPQSRYVQNAAYIRLKNLTLNYSLPLQVISKAGLSSVQIYFAGMNLWEYTKMHKPLDPESVYTTTQEYYQQRIYTLGFRLTF